MATGVKPRPAIESAIDNVSDVIGRQIVSHLISLVHRCPKFACLRAHCDSHRVSDPPREHAKPRAVGIELENVRAVELRGVRIWIVYVRVRAYGSVHLLAARREGNVARPVPATVQRSSTG